MSSSKKIDLQMDFAAGVYLSEAQNPIPSPHTVNVYALQEFLTLTLTSESVYGSQFFHCKLLQVLMS
jgi:hypothetical protein